MFPENEVQLLPDYFKHVAAVRAGLEKRGVTPDAIGPPDNTPDGNDVIRILEARQELLRPLTIGRIRPRPEANDPGVPPLVDLWGKKLVEVKEFLRKAEYGKALNALDPDKLPSGPAPASVTVEAVTTSTAGRVRSVRMSP